MLENEFGTNKEDEAVLKILEKGDLQEFEVSSNSIPFYIFPSPIQEAQSLLCVHFDGLAQLGLDCVKRLHSVHLSTEHRLTRCTRRWRNVKAVETTPTARISRPKQASSRLSQTCFDTV